MYLSGTALVVMFMSVMTAMKSSELDQLHKSPASWALGVIYFSPRDPRLLVRKRIASLGWTLNFARPLAIPLLIGTIGSLWAGLSVLADSDLSNSVKWAGALGLLAALIVTWAWLANPRRYVD